MRPAAPVIAILVISAKYIVLGEGKEWEFAGVKSI
jgi:hypothetical protein